MNDLDTFELTDDVLDWTPWQMNEFPIKAFNDAIEWDSQDDVVVNRWGSKDGS